jgi:hypothetical protein
MSTDNQFEVAKRVIAKAWSSPDYKKGLISEPNKTFAKEGLEISEPIKVSEVEKGEKIFFLPKSPDGATRMDMISLQEAAATHLSRDAEMF